MKATRLLFLVICLVLSGCSKPKFACKPGLGVNCRSMHEIHTAIMEDRLDELIAETNDPKSRKNKKECKGCSDLHKPQKDKAQKINHKTGKQVKTLGIISDDRDNPKKHEIRIWIAPFTNDASFDVSAHYIYVRS